MSSSPERPVPSTGRWRKPHCNRRAGSRAGEGAFLGCLGAESPPATVATHTRRDRPQPHTQSSKTRRGARNVATRVGTCTCSDMRVQIHAARSWPCTREHAQRRMRGLIDTHRARLWPCMWGHSHAAAHMPRHSTAVHMWTHMWAHAALTMQGHKRAHTHIHAHTRAHGGRCRHTPPSKCHRAARPRAEHPPAVTSPRGRDPKQAACPQLPGAPGGQGVGGGRLPRSPGSRLRGRAAKRRLLAGAASPAR